MAGWRGRHGGYTESGTPPEFAAVVDLDIADGVLKEREGRQKVDNTGHAADINWIGCLNFGMGKRYRVVVAGATMEMTAI